MHRKIRACPRRNIGRSNRETAASAASLRRNSACNKLHLAVAGLLVEVADGVPWARGELWDRGLWPRRLAAPAAATAILLHRLGGRHAAAAAILLLLEELLLLRLDRTAAFSSECCWTLFTHQ